MGMTLDAFISKTIALVMNFLFAAHCSVEYPGALVIVIKAWV